MIIRCPHCGAGQAVRYQLGRAPGSACCPACGRVFPFFPALEIEIVGQPRAATVASPESRLGDPDRKPVRLPRETPAQAAGMEAPATRIAREPRAWPLRLMGLLVGVALIASLGAQFLVHDRARIADQPELVALSDALCRHLPCPGAEPRAPGAIRIEALRLEQPVDGRLRVEMEITNGLQRPQPWPLLEIALSDRFGRVLGQARWHPGEYLGPYDGAPGSTRTLEAGEVRRLRLVILAPDRPIEGVSVWAL